MRPHHELDYGTRTAPRVPISFIGLAIAVVILVLNGYLWAPFLFSHGHARADIRLAPDFFSDRLAISFAAVLIALGALIASIWLRWLRKARLYLILAIVFEIPIMVFSLLGFIGTHMFGQLSPS